MKLQEHDQFADQFRGTTPLSPPTTGESTLGDQTNSIAPYNPEFSQSVGRTGTASFLSGSRHPRNLHVHPTRVEATVGDGRRLHAEDLAGMAIVVPNNELASQDQTTDIARVSHATA